MAEIMRTLQKHEKYDEKVAMIKREYEEKAEKLDAKRRSASQDRSGGRNNRRFDDGDDFFQSSNKPKRARSQSRRRFEEDNDRNRSSNNESQNDDPRDPKPIAPRKYVKKSDLLAGKYDQPKTIKEVK